MTFSAGQVKELMAPLNRAHVRQREQGGRQLSYIEAWHAISEANRVFGFDGWSSKTIDLRCVSERERKIGKQQRDGWSVTYTAKCRVTVGGVVREGVGSGHGIDVDLGLAHESAIKEAESDSRKRALMTFGNIFGLALYDKEQNNVADPVDESVAMYIAACELAIDTAREAKALHDWWNSDAEKENRRTFALDAMQLASLKQSVRSKLDQLKAMQKDAA